MLSDLLNNETPFSPKSIEARISFIVFIFITAVITPNKSLFSSLIARAKTKELFPVIFEVITSEKVVVKFSLFFNI